MPNSSWSRKVARAAGTGGGKTNRGRIPWSYYAVIGLVVVLGVLGVLLSKNGSTNAAATTTTTVVAAAPAVGQTENEAVAFYFCGAFAPNVPQAKSDPYGLTTQGDGVMHIDPTNASAAGNNATLGKWASANGVTLSATEVQVPKGKLYKNGAACEGGKGKVYVKQFAFAGDSAGVLVKGNPTAIHLQDQSELVVAFVPASKSAKIPGPPASVVAKLKALGATTSPTTSSPSPAAASTTTPAAGSAGSSAGGATTTTPAAGSSATTTAGGASTTTAGGSGSGSASGSGTTAPTTGASSSTSSSPTS